MRRNYEVNCEETCEENGQKNFEQFLRQSSKPVTPIKIVDRFANGSSFDGRKRRIA